MSNFKKSVITIIIVTATFALVGFDTWLIVSQRFGNIIPLAVTAFIAVALALFIFNMINILSAKSIEKTEVVTNNSTFLNTSNTDSIKKNNNEDNKKSEKEKKTVITV